MLFTRQYVGLLSCTPQHYPKHKLSCYFPSTRCLPLGAICACAVLVLPSNTLAYSWGLTNQEGKTLTALSWATNILRSSYHSWQYCHVGHQKLIFNVVQLAGSKNARQRARRHRHHSDPRYLGSAGVLAPSSLVHVLGSWGIAFTLPAQAPCSYRGCHKMCLHAKAELKLHSFELRQETELGTLFHSSILSLRFCARYSSSGTLDYVQHSFR